MRRLVDGAYAVVSKPPLDSHVLTMNHHKRVAVSAEHADALRRLAHGVEEYEPTDPLFLHLQLSGLADDGLDAVDAVVSQRLEELGRGFAWHLRDHPLADPLVRLLRRAHARRKVSFFQFGQTACLPESAAARCLEMTGRMGARRRVLLVGDDDMLCLALARMGHQVTVIDIDEVLIDFLRRVAAEEDLPVDARVQDVLAPVPADLVDSYDAVITDPLSYESCLVAFLSRAALAVHEGGAVFCCVHPLAREMFQRVVWGLPVTVEDCLYELSAYYYEGFIENWYRSDLYVLRRTSGSTRWSDAESIPLGNIIAGSLKDRSHAFTDIGSLPFRKPTLEGVQTILDGWAQQAGSLVVSRHAWHDDGWAHFYVALAHGGHLAVVLDRRKGTLAYDLYPFSRELDASITAAFTRNLSLTRTITFSRQAPDLASPTIAPPARKPGS